ncbi:MAG: DUF2817 domain-containing protein [Ignavibacterium sp.]|nr:DUF2817 domain-containing protein [Ignavibacterium sp.]
MMKCLLFIFLFFSINLFPQLIKTPLENNNYEKLTSYEELTEFIYYLEDLSDVLTVEVIGKSVEGRNLYALKYSKSEFGKDDAKIKVLFFAQQHGNEQSGKEGALLLAVNLLKPENKYLFDKIDLILIPQMNPDGSEINQRRNANSIDLNRNHLILTEPETIALHKLFNNYLFEVTLDVHEYFPYTQSWEQFGIYKRADEQLGLLTNLNVSEKIRKYSKQKVLPFVENYLSQLRFSFNEYLVGGPPDKERLRHSTVDINDGRQSFGIQNTLSFILEGKNGKDYAVENIRHRSEGQSSAMMSLLKFGYQNKDEIKSMIAEERNTLAVSGSPVVIRMDHINKGEKFILPVEDVRTGHQKVFEVNQYYSDVKNIYQISVPDAYLVPRNDSLLMSFIINHGIEYSDELPEHLNIEKYIITSIDSIVLEDEKMAAPKFKVHKKNLSEISLDYILIPTNQLKKNVIVAAFEIRSMHAIYHYDLFSYMIKEEEYPVIRVFKD